jgi:hypothetical protein
MHISYVHFFCELEVEFSEYMREAETEFCPREAASILSVFCLMKEDWVGRLDALYAQTHARSA